MGKSGRAVFIGLFLLAALVAGCSSDGESAGNDPAGDNSTPEAETAPASVAERCEQGARDIADRLDEFIGGFGDISPEEFLGQDDIEGLAVFQDDVAQIIAATANQSSTLCNLDGLQRFVDAELAGRESQSLLANVLVSSIRFGGVLEQADVSVGLEDDIWSILSLLDDGSSMTLEPGVYELDVAMLVQREITIVGAGAEATTIRSTSAEAAIAVFGGGKLTMRDLAVEHVGDQPSSIILAFGAPLDVERIRVSGAVSSDDTSGGNGILLSTGVVNEDGVTAEPPSDAPAVETSRVVDSDVFGNGVAGVTVIGDLEPLIASNRIFANTLCGICFLGAAGGTAQQNLIEDNEFGIQVGDESSPTVVENTSRDNVIAGMVILGTATPTVVDNQVIDNGEVGIAVQANASPIIQRNTVEGHVFGLTFVGESTASVLRTTVIGAEVGMQIAEQAAPEIAESTIVDSTNIAMVHRDQSTGIFEANTIRGEQAVGALVEGQSQPTIRSIIVEGSEVGVSYREQAAGTLSDSDFVAPAIGIQLEDEAAPTISTNRIDRPEAAGVVIRTTGAVEVVANVVTDPESLGIGAAGESNALIQANTVTGGETAISFVEMAGGEVRDNVLIGQVISIQVGDTASPQLVENRIEDAAGAAIVFRDDATGSAVANRILNPTAVGIQVVEQANPEVNDNVLLAELPVTADADAADEAGDDEADEADEAGDAGGAGESGDAEADEAAEADGAGETGEVGADAAGATDDDENAVESDETAPGDDDSTVGILFAGDATGSASGNQVLGFVIGIQISESAAPQLENNLVDGGTTNGVGLLYRDDAAGSAVANTTTGHSIGFQISDQASPVLTGNVVERAVDVAFLVQGTSTAELSDNTCPASIPGIGLLEQAAPVLGENRCATANG